MCIELLLVLCIGKTHSIFIHVSGALLGGMPEHKLCKSSQQCQGWPSSPKEKFLCTQVATSNQVTI